jgi:hypothetical protein
MAQLDIFAVAARKAAPPAEAPPYQVHNDTSRQAAQAIAPAAGTLRAAVLHCITVAGEQGMTDEEGCAMSEMNPSTWRPRRGELEKGGFIRDTGRTRKSTAGRDMVVWCSTGGGGGDHDGAP